MSEDGFPLHHGQGGRKGFFACSAALLDGLAGFRVLAVPRIHIGAVFFRMGGAPASGFLAPRQRRSLHVSPVRVH